MKTIDIIGYKRTDFSKSATNKLREEGMVPCVLYGAEDHVHFNAPVYLFNDLVNTPDVAFVNIDVEGKEYRCILQDIQYHPVSDMILHADFRELTTGKKVKMEIPIKLIGTAPGVMEGGVLVRKLRQATIKALPKNMPEVIELDISDLSLGQSLKVKDLVVEAGEILNSERITVTSVEVPRALRGKSEEDEELEGEEGEEGEEGAAEGEEKAEGAAEEKSES
ncbi:MAG: 50S ribosomal protein L25/general stress protein Ctc [Cytophagales bacterium]